MCIKRGLYVFCFLFAWAAALCLPGSGAAAELSMTRDRGLFPGGVQVAATKLAVHADGDHLQVSGQLKRLHPVLVGGHLHVYGHAETGEVVAESHCRVPGLNSKRAGMMHIPFRVTIAANPEAVTAVSLEYHSLGHEI